MAEKELYVYPVTRVHMHEQGLLSVQDLEQLISANTVNEAFRYLSDKGWGSPDLPPNDADALLGYETDRTWGLIAELLDDMTPFNVFLIANDYHNVKAAIKLAFTANEDEEENARYFLKYGTIPLETIVKAANEHDFSALPPAMAEAGRAAYETLAHTGIGQNSDMVIDRAALIAVGEAGKKAESQLLRRYAQLMVDSANIKAAVRSACMGKTRDFIQRAIAPAGTLDTTRLTDAAAVGTEAIYGYLKSTEYAGAVEALERSMAEFERWCDNHLVQLIKPQRYNYFSIEPLAAFILGRENEIKMVRLILSAKINHLNSDVLRERLRETYV